jgi:hypothetical protein
LGGRLFGRLSDVQNLFIGTMTIAARFATRRFSLMLRLLLLAASIAAVTPASASVGIWCTGPEGVSFDAPLSGGVGLSVMSATVEAAGKTWTTETSPEDPQAIIPAQAWAGDDFMWFDFADTNIERNVVEVRIHTTDEGEHEGTLEIAGVGSWAVSCMFG